MYSNDDHEPKLPGVDPALEHTLDRLQPRPDPAFAQSLEARVLQRIHAGQGNRVVAVQRWSWTLTATLVTVMLLATIFAIGRSPTFGPIFSAAPIQTATPTLVPPTFTPTPAVSVIMPLNLQPMVITRTTLLGGTHLAGDILAELSIVWMNADYVPESTFTDMTALAGMVLLRPVRAWEPILARNVVEQDAVDQLPAETVAVAIPIERITAVFQTIHEGQEVDVFASMLFVAADDIYQVPLTVSPIVTPTPELRLSTNRIAHRALVVKIGEIEEMGDGIDYVQLAVASEEARVLQWALDAMLPLNLVEVE
jgi:hypothetical protein